MPIRSKGSVLHPVENTVDEWTTHDQLTSKGAKKRYAGSAPFSLSLCF